MTASYNKWNHCAVMSNSRFVVDFHVCNTHYTAEQKKTFSRFAKIKFSVFTKFSIAESVAALRNALARHILLLQVVKVVQNTDFIDALKTIKTIIEHD